MHAIFSVLVGEKSAVFGSKLDQIPASDEEDDIRNKDGATVFSSSWLPGGDSRFDLPYLPLLLWLSLTHILVQREYTHIFFVSMIFYCVYTVGLPKGQKLLCDAIIFQQGQAS